MTSLSRIIKSHIAEPHVYEQKIIQIKKIQNGEELSLISEETETSTRNPSVMEAAKQAEKILLAAQQQAEQISMHMKQEVESWNEEKQILIEEARREGFRNGQEQGRLEAQKEYEHLLEFAKEIVDQAKKEYRSIVGHSELTILNLGIKVADKIMNQHLDENKEEYLYIVKKAIKEARECKNIELHVPPLHYSFVQSHKKELMNLFPKEIEFYVYPDDELEENGCVIESSNGRLVASVDEQLEQIRIKLQEILEEDLS